MEQTEGPASQLSARQCPVCKKLYADGTTSRARSKHASYCRKKNESGPIARRKACDGCVRSKVRCSLRTGGCARCVSRGISCSYRVTMAGQDIFNPALEADNDSGPVPTRPQLSHTPPADILPQFPSDFRLSLEFPSAATGEVTSATGSPSLTNSAWESDIFGSEWLFAPNLTPDLDEGHRFGPHAGAISNDRDEMQYTLSTATHPEYSTQSLPRIDYKGPFPFLERRKFSEPDFELTGDLALHILRSYPHMIANLDSPPPFVHPQYQRVSRIDPTRPSPLYAALKLTKLLLQTPRMNKSLIWGLIRNEQERLLNENPVFTKWEVLEALQSLVIFLLLRIVEGHHEYTNFDTQLLATINAICRHITTKYGELVSSDELAGRMVSWEDWVYFESRRRTATVVLIINTILYAQLSERPETMLEYSYSPAPSPLKLWHAENEMDWTIEYTEYLKKNAIHGMVSNSDLAELKEATGKQHDRWYAYADSFGLLVTLAANITT